MHPINRLFEKKFNLEYELKELEDKPVKSILENARMNNLSNQIAVMK
jgi:hypothetical protein